MANGRTGDESWQQRNFHISQQDPVVSLTEIARIEAPRVRSLVWAGDELIDWADGGRRFRLDGETVKRAVYYPYRFDAACQSPSNEYTVIYERLGTKGLILKQGQIIREVNRSYYHAEVYEYPLAIVRLPAGREVLVHCPNEYNRIEIEDIATGECITKRDDRDPSDFFHSRLATNTNGTLLISAGWVWHPCDLVAVFSLADALADARALDFADATLDLGSEVSSAAFLNDEELVLATSQETFLDDADFQDPKYLRPNSLAIFHVGRKRIMSRVNVAGPVGTILPINEKYIVDFYDSPKVIDVSTGEVITSLPDLKTGKQASSIIWHQEALPPLAIDTVRKRFAVANGDFIHVIAAG